MLRNTLLSLTALAALATPALAGNPQQAASPSNTQACSAHCEDKSEGRTAVGLPMRPEMLRPDGTMKNGLLPNPPTYG